MVGKLVASSRTYFDGQDFEGLGLGQAAQGKPMREAVWLKEKDGDPWISSKRNAYNADGLLVETRDGGGWCGFGI